MYATRDGGGEVPGLTHFSFSLESVDLVSRATKPKVRSRLIVPSALCTRQRYVPSFWVWSRDRDSVVVGWRHFGGKWSRPKDVADKRKGAILVADGSFGANPQRGLVSDIGPRLMSGRTDKPPTAQTNNRFL